MKPIIFNLNVLVSKLDLLDAFAEEFGVAEVVSLNLPMSEAWRRAEQIEAFVKECAEKSRGHDAYVVPYVDPFAPAAPTQFVLALADRLGYTPGIVLTTSYEGGYRVGGITRPKRVQAIVVPPGTDTRGMSDADFWGDVLHD